MSTTTRFDDEHQGVVLLVSDEIKLSIDLSKCDDGCKMNFKGLLFIKILCCFIYFCHGKLYLQIQINRPSVKTNSKRKYSWRFNRYILVRFE